MERNATIKMIKKVMVNQGMKLIDTKPFKDISGRESLEFICMDLRKGSLYLVRPVDADRADDLAIQRSYTQEMLDSVKDRFQIAADRVFILYILLTEKQQDIGEVDFPVPDMEREQIEIYWILEEQSQRLVFPPNQPNSFLNLERELTNALAGKPVETYVTENSSKKSYLTIALIVVNILVWLAQEMMGGSAQTEILLQMGAANPLLIRDGQWFRLLTAMFLHIGMMHLLMNAVGIFIFGSRLEKKIHTGEMALIYFGGGVIGNLASYAYHLATGDLHVVAAGASGGVYALMGALLGVTYLTRRRAGGLDAYAIFLYFLIGFISSAVDIRIDLAAHLGGFVAGLVISGLFLRRKKQTV